MIPKRFATRAAALAMAGAAALTSVAALAADPIKIGLVVPMSGPFSYMGRQINAGVSLYMAEHGDTVDGRKVEIVLKDDAGVPANTRRIAEELVVNDKVTVLAGFGLSPQAFATAPVATQAKTPMVVMQAATSSVTEKSPFIVRTSMTLPQVTVGLAEWASKNNVKKVVSMVSDYAPGVDAETAFNTRFTADGGQILAALRMPPNATDFSPYLQRAADAKPDAVFVFVPAGDSAAIFMKQFAERGMDKANIKLLGTGDVVDDDALGQMSDSAIGTISSHHYSAAHPSEMNKKFVAAIEKANKGMRPSFMAVGGYDGMHVIMEGLKATHGAGGEALVDAMKGQQFESPRGPVLIDPKTRDIVQNVYIRKVEKVDGKLYNVEFETKKDVKDPGKTP